MEPRARLYVLVRLAAVEQLVDRVLLVEEALTLREEVPQPIDAAPDVAADEPGLEVVGEDLLDHRLRRGMALQDREVALEQRHQLLVAQA